MPGKLPSTVAASEWQTPHASTPNAHLVAAGIPKRPPHFSELSWFPYLNGFVGLTHFRCSLFDIPERRRSCRGASKELAVRLDAFVTAAPPFDPPQGKLVFDKRLR